MTVKNPRSRPKRNARDRRPLSSPLAIADLNDPSAGRSRIIESHRIRLSEIHQPETAEEVDVVERLAKAQAKLDEAQAAWDERLCWQKEHNDELYDRGQLERFRADLKAWRNDPHAMRMVFGETWHSATFLRDIWCVAGLCLKTENGQPFDIVKDIVLTQNTDWRVDRIDPFRGRVMGWYLALQTDAETALYRWVAESRAGRTDTGDFETDMKRARAFLAAAPKPDDAMRLFHDLVHRMSGEWADSAKRLTEAAAVERARYAQTPPPHALGGAEDVRETRRMRRELNKAEIRFDKLERRLFGLLKQRRQTRPVHAGNRSKVVQPAAVIALESVAKRQSNGGERLRACSVETSPESPPADTNHETEMTHHDAASTTGDELIAAESPDPNSEPAGPVRPVRRPNPKSIAKAWRAKHAGDRAKSKHRSSRSAR